AGHRREFDWCVGYRSSTRPLPSVVAETPSPVAAKPSACRFRCPPLPELCSATGLPAERVHSSTSSRSSRDRKKSPAAIPLPKASAFSSSSRDDPDDQRIEEDRRV